MPVLTSLLVVTVFLILVSVNQEALAGKKEQRELEIARIYFEFNSSGNDLGVHVFLDGEDWRDLKIFNPKKRKVFQVSGHGPYRDLGLTELFFEGAEPSLDDVSLYELLALFPAGDYKFKGKNVDKENIVGIATLSHAIPAGPENVNAVLNSNSLVISWDEVTGPPVGFPNEPINIVGYQVIVDTFQVTVPSTTLSVTVSPEFVESLDPGEHEFEVLAIEEGGNQSITEDTFIK